MHAGKPLILFIDAYDSFSNNIISLLETTLCASVRTIKIDDPALASDEALQDELRHYTAVVCGPGPGHPGKEEDIGIIRRIWKLGSLHMLPVLGICLGFQSLCAEFGGGIKRLKGPQHGMIRRVTHIGELDEGEDTIFEGVGEIHATHYQSLCADIGHGSMPTDYFQAMKWIPTETCPDLVPLAWAEWDGNEDNDSGMKDEKILVAVQHRTKPFWALQYHPESICNNRESDKIILNWFLQAEQWNCASRKLRIKLGPDGHALGAPAVRESLLHQYERAFSIPGSIEPTRTNLLLKRDMSEFGLDHIYQCHTVKLPDHMAVPDIMEVLQDTKRDQIILESSNAHEINTDVKGRYSIIGLDVDEGLRFEYCTEMKFIEVMYSDGNMYENSTIDLTPYGGVWPFLAQFLEKRHVSNGNPESPFWGGFMGYTTYEMGLEGIEVESKARTKAFHSRPDLCFAWVTRSLVIDHEKGLIYLQDLSKKTPENSMPPWMVIAALKLGALSLPNAKYHLNSAASLRASEERYSSSRSSMSHVEGSGSTDSLAFPSRPTSFTDSIESSPESTSHQASVISIKTPSDSAYEAKVRRCQEHINNGDSYELCLTDQTTVQRHRSDRLWLDHDYNNTSTNADSWSLYRTLRTRQPAPFASHIRLGAATLISASPERFLKWSADGQCELRPMKGTVRKSAAVSTLEQAKALLDVPKEKAENLMIVDLVRHDLHGVCGAGNVTVPRLMVVEEYKSVFQMISIVRGQIPRSHHSRPTSNYTGIDVLAASLPPGSMTGAPKKRSCEILSEIEKKERSLYSGVVGYMDIGGRGDWSVTIRSMFRWDDEGREDGMETWHIGAGGAVTTLSTEVGEREEMQTKLRSTLGIFQ